MEKLIFKKRDRVFDIRFGWGIVITENIVIDSFNPMVVQFDDEELRNYYTLRGKDITKLLSFTEYELQGFSQERPVNYEEYVGKWGKFWDDNKERFIIGKLLYYSKDGDDPFESEFNWFENFEPLTEEQIKVLNLK